MDDELTATARALAHIRRQQTPSREFMEMMSRLPKPEAQLAPGQKCTRCRKVLPEVGTVPGFPDLCCRCADAVEHWAVQAFDAAYRAAITRGATKAEAEIYAGKLSANGFQPIEDDPHA